MMNHHFNTEIELYTFINSDVCTCCTESTPILNRRVNIFIRNRASVARMRNRMQKIQIHIMFTECISANIAANGQDVL